MSLFSKKKKKNTKLKKEEIVDTLKWEGAENTHLMGVLLEEIKQESL